MKPVSNASSPCKYSNTVLPDAKTFDVRKSMQFVEGQYNNHMKIEENTAKVNKKEIITEPDTFSNIKAASLINPHEVNNKIK